MGDLSVDATNRPDRLSNKLVLIFAALTLLAAGCGGGSSSSGLASGGTAAASKKHSLHGIAHGGQNPVAGASVKLYAVGTDGAASNILLASTTTDDNGRFNISSIDCSSIEGFNTYIVATGGDSGNGPNSAIALTAALDDCELVAEDPSTTVVINELTTVATEWSLQQFADLNGQNFSSELFNEGGLSEAVATYGNLADINSDSSVSGNPSSFLPTAAQCASGSPPVNCDALLRLNTIADIIAACVNSSGPTSTPCATLLCDSQPGGSYVTMTSSCSTVPATDTLQAAFAMAQSPMHKVTSLFALATPNAPFEPTLRSAPDGWEIALNYTTPSANFDVPDAIAIDLFGDVLVSNRQGNSVSELLASDGYQDANVLSAPGVTVDFPNALAFDSANNLFVVNGNGNSVSEFYGDDFTSGRQIDDTYAPGADFNFPIALAFDTSSNLFVVNYSGGSDNNGSVTELSAPDYTTATVFDDSSSIGADFDGPSSIGLDNLGNLFLTNLNGNSVTQLNATGPNPYTTAKNFNNSNTSPAADFDGPFALVLTGANNLLATNSGGNSVTELFAGGMSPYLTTSSFNNTSDVGAHFNDPEPLAIDGAANVFVANTDGNTVTELVAQAYGEAIAIPYSSALNFAPPGAGFRAPLAVAIDGSGNVFVANSEGNSVSQIIGVAVPAKNESAGPTLNAILVFLTLLGVWYGRKLMLD